MECADGFRDVECELDLRELDQGLLQSRVHCAILHVLEHKYEQGAPVVNN